MWKVIILKLLEKLRSRLESWSTYLEKLVIGLLCKTVITLPESINCVKSVKKLVERTFKIFTEVKQQVILRTRNNNCKIVNDYILN